MTDANKTCLMEVVEAPVIADDIVIAAHFSEDRARSLAGKLNADPDDEWLYLIVPHAGKFVIEAYDEDEQFLGYL